MWLIVLFTISNFCSLIIKKKTLEAVPKFHEPRDAVRSRATHPHTCVCMRGEHFSTEMCTHSGTPGPVRRGRVPNRAGQGDFDVRPTWGTSLPLSCPSQPNPPLPSTFGGISGGSASHSDVQRCVILGDGRACL